MSIKRTLAFILVIMMIAGLTACGNGNKSDSSKQSSSETKSNSGSTTSTDVAAGSETDSASLIEVTIPSFKTGENVGAKFFLPQVERFNKEYEGKYKLNIEEVPQASYNDKLKQLAQQKKLPVMMHNGDEDWFNTVAIPQGLPYDLSDWLESNPDIKKILFDESVAYCTRDEKIVALPLFLIRPVGFYYNDSLYQPEKKPNEMTMDEFVKSLGDNKIAFQTADNGWTTALLYTALIANEEGGAELLRDNVLTYIDDFSAPAIVKATEKLYDLLSTKASANSIGAAYADAANAFMSNQAAVIANGPWMAADFAETDKWSNGFDGKMAVGAMYPGNIGISRPAAFGEFWIADSATDEEKELALAFLSFICRQEEIEAYALAEGGVNPKLEYSADFETELAKTKVLKELSDATNDNTLFVPNVLDILPVSVRDVEFGKLLPKLADGSYSPKEFCEQITKKIQEAKS